MLSITSITNPATVPLSTSGVGGLSAVAMAHPAASSSGPTASSSSSSSSMYLLSSPKYARSLSVPPSVSAEDDGSGVPYNGSSASDATLNHTPLLHAGKRQVNGSSSSRQLMAPQQYGMKSAAGGLGGGKDGSGEGACLCRSCAVPAVLDHRPCV